MELITADFLSNQIRQILLRRIIEGQYKQGQKLSPLRLADEFKVSRSPVKDALNMLSGAGIVDITSKGGYSIKVLTKKHLMDLFGFRIVLELHAAKHAQSLWNAECLGRLRQTACISAPLVKSEDPDDILRLIELDTEFHSVIVSATGNDVIIEHYENVNNLLSLARMQISEAKKSSSEMIVEHQKILDALETANQETLEEALIQHNAQVKERFLQSSTFLDTVHGE